MPQPNQKPAKTADLQDLADTLAGTVTDVIARLTPLTRLRLLAFMHMIEHPETTTAELEFASSGLMRLTLASTETPARRRH
jgi:hypothetical protein